METFTETQPLVTGPANAEIEPINKDTQNERALQLEKGFSQYVKANTELRVNLRNAQINGFRADGVRPYKVFEEIVGQYSRADNIGCGINGEADHEVVAQYLREESETAKGDMKDILNWLAVRGQDLATYRRIVKDFLVLDQLTDPINYGDDRIVDENTTTGFRSSIREIDSRVLPARVKDNIMKRISETSGVISSWREERAAYAVIGRELLPFINPKNPEAANPVIENGAPDDDNVGQRWRAAIDSTEVWTQNTSKTIDEGELGKVGDAMLEFMDRLTEAEAVLESQYYHVGVALLRSIASGKFPDKCREIIKADLAKATI